jgi:hypothetical protein
VSKKSKKELAKAETKLAKAQKMQAKAMKMKHEAIRMQLAMMQAGEATGQMPHDSLGALIIRPETPQQDKAAIGATTASQGTDSNIGLNPANTPDAASPIAQHIRRNRFLYTAAAGVLILAVIYLGYAAAKRGQAATKVSTPAGYGQRGIAEAPAPPEKSQGLPTSVVVLDKWEMPDELYEISSNAFIDADRVACIQDADGIIYTYNLKTRKIESRLKFAGPGDFEALSVVGNTFYALRSDGHLYEVQPGTSGKPSVNEYDLPLKAANETEPMFYDQPNNRLLVGVKEQDPQSDDYKGVYSFDLATKTMKLKPVMTIPSEHEVTRSDADGNTKSKKKLRPIKPSEIALDPRSGDLYVLNGPHAEFLILDKSGALKQVIQLDKSIFPQPEGMCFSASGELYISSEGAKKGAGVIAKVELR